MQAKLGARSRAHWSTAKSCIPAAGHHAAMPRGSWQERHVGAQYLSSNAMQKRGIERSPAAHLKNSSKDGGRVGSRQQRTSRHMVALASCMRATRELLPPLPWPM